MKHPDGQRVLVTASELLGFQRFQGFVFILAAATGAILEQIPLPEGFAEGLAFRSGDPTRPLPPPGDFSSLTRNDNGTPQNPTDDTWVRRMKDGTEHLFSATGLHLETRNRNGNRTIYAYDAAGGPPPGPDARRNSVSMGPETSARCPPPRGRRASIVTTAATA